MSKKNKDNLEQVYIDQFSYAEILYVTVALPDTFGLGIISSESFHASIVDLVKEANAVAVQIAFTTARQSLVLGFEITGSDDDLSLFYANSAEMIQSGADVNDLDTSMFYIPFPVLRDAGTPFLLYEAHIKTPKYLFALIAETMDEFEIEARIPRRVLGIKISDFILNQEVMDDYEMAYKEGNLEEQLEEAAGPEKAVRPVALKSQKASIKA